MSLPLPGLAKKIKAERIRREKLRAEGLVIPIEKKEIPWKTDPIPPHDFADMMRARMHGLNPAFFCEGKVREGFNQFGAAYNDCIYENQNDSTKQIIVPSATGSGKTVSSRLYLAEIAELGLSGLLVVSEVEVAMEAAAELNKLAGADVAGAYYTISSDHPKTDLWYPLGELPQIAIITHSLFLSRSDTGKDIDKIRSFQGEQRDIIIIDERISLIKRISFNVDELFSTAADFGHDGRAAGEVELLTHLANEFKADSSCSERADQTKFREDCITLSHSLRHMRRKLQRGDYDLQSKRRRDRKKSTDELRTSIIDLLSRVIEVISDRFSITADGNAITVHREKNLSDKFGSCMVLDATSLVNPEYQYRSLNDHNIQQLVKIQSRDYSTVLAHVCDLPGAKQSKEAIFNTPLRQKQLKDYASAYLSAVGNELVPGDKALVVTYKDLIPIFNELNPYNGKNNKPLVTFIYWGSKDARGSNEFKDYNKVFIVGWWRKPQHYYVSAVLAINTYEDYLSTTGSIWGDANHLKAMLIADDIVQVINRIRCRTPIDADGKCEPCQVYFFTGGDKGMEAQLKRTLKLEMPGITFSSWKPKGDMKLLRKRTKTLQRIDALIKFLLDKSSTHETITAKEVRAEMGVSAKHLNNMQQHPPFLDALREENISSRRAEGRGNPVEFILPKRGTTK